MHLSWKDICLHPLSIKVISSLFPFRSWCAYCVLFCLYGCCSQKSYLYEHKLQSLRVPAPFSLINLTVWIGQSFRGGTSFPQFQRFYVRDNSTNQPGNLLCWNTCSSRIYVELICALPSTQICISSCTLLDIFFYTALRPFHTRYCIWIRFK